MSGTLPKFLLWNNLCFLVYLLAPRSAEELSDTRETSRLNYWERWQLTSSAGHCREAFPAYLAVSALGGGQLGQHALLHVLALLHHHLEDGQRVGADWLLLTVIFLLQGFKVSL